MRMTRAEQDAALRQKAQEGANRVMAYLDHMAKTNPNTIWANRRFTYNMLVGQFFIPENMRVGRLENARSAKDFDRDQMAQYFAAEPNKITTLIERNDLGTLDIKYLRSYSDSDHEMAEAVDLYFVDGKRVFASNGEINPHGEDDLRMHIEGLREEADRLAREFLPVTDEA